jgi:steroid delta-isomerase-like uncharacterized protein
MAAVDSLDAHKELIRRYTTAVDHDAPSAIHAYLAESFVGHLPGAPGPLDRAGFVQFATTFYGAFPDLQHTIEDLLADGDRVTGRFTLRGTHRAAFQGIPATGQAICFGAIAVCRIAEGTIAELWMQMDSLALLQQLGALPAPAAA